MADRLDEAREWLYRNGFHGRGDFTVQFAHGGTVDLAEILTMWAERAPEPEGTRQYRTKRFALRCPHCDKEGQNSKGHGGNEKCFHCGSCEFVECEWSSPAHERHPVAESPSSASEQENKNG